MSEELAQRAATAQPESAAPTTGALLGWARRELAAAPHAEPTDAEILLAHFAESSRASVLAFPERVLESARAVRFMAAIGRRVTGEPVAYLTGTREFYSLPLGVSPAVLVPRPETELLVETGLRYIAGEAAAPGRSESMHPSPAVLDLGTGSGAIALALKALLPAAEVTAVDNDANALAVARENAARLGIEVDFIESDWFAALGDARFDLIVANPPYVRSDDPHFGGPLRHEPRAALDGGADGLDAIRMLLRDAPPRLNAGACLVLEHGFDQRAAVAALAAAHGFEVVEALDDLAGLARAVVLRVSPDARP